VPSVFGHALFGCALGASAGARGCVLAAAVFCAVAPDLDVLAFRFGVPYEAPFGHRGFTHSLAFAAALGLSAALLTRIALRAEARPPFGRTAALLALATASHGFFDALTDGGLGVAFFWPLDGTRYFLPWRPIAVSPLAVGRFFSARGFEVVTSEAVWVGLSAVALRLGSRACRTNAS
jgi:inner membrane protein